MKKLKTTKKILVIVINTKNSEESKKYKIHETMGKTLKTSRFLVLTSNFMADMHCGAFFFWQVIRFIELF